MDGLAGADWVIGECFTAADSYLLTFRRWAIRIGADVAAHPGWAALVGRVLERPAVQRALTREGLTPSEFGHP